MRTVTPSDEWPESWRHAYGFDRIEIFGDPSNPGHTRAYHTRARHVLEMATSVLSPGDRVLDLAAAQGNYTLWLAERGYDVTWNDLRGELAGYVRLKHELGTVRYAPGDAFDLRFGQLFDLVLITEIIEHVAHPDALLSHAARLTRPGGHVLLSTPNGEYFQWDRPRFSDTTDPGQYETTQFQPDVNGHIFLLHEDELGPLAAAAGLELCEVRLFTNPLTNGFLKTSALLRVLPNAVIESVERGTRRLPRALVRRLHTSMAMLMRRP